MRRAQVGLMGLWSRLARTSVSDAHCVLDGKLRLAIETLPQRFAGDERHHIVEISVCLPGIVQRQNVRMLEVRRRPNLGEESLGAERGGQLGVQHLERDLARVLHVASEIDGRHAARAELALYLVAASECEDK